MPKVAPVQRRKAEHLRINLEHDVASARTTGLERLHFGHEALPELSYNEIDTTVKLFGRQLRLPILISSMTGGTAEARTINQRLAEAAQGAGIALGVGSQRAALENPSLASSFQVRKAAPNVLLFANLGAVQLNYGYGVDECRRAVDMIQADALVLHLNALQEALQDGGNTNFAGLARKIGTVCRKVGVPVVVKEVGWGISEHSAGLLAEAGVAAIDVAGAGGTSWSQVEMHRAPDEHLRALAASFVDWGIPTVESILFVKRGAPNTTIFASGGLRDGIDIAKCLALGATLGGMAGPFLRAAAVSSDKAADAIRLAADQLRACMFAVGAADLRALRRARLTRS